MRAAFGSQRLCDRYRFDEADQADQHGRREQCLGQLQIQRRQGERRQALWDRADDLYPSFVQIQQGDDRDGDQ